MSELLWVAVPGGRVSEGNDPRAVLRALIVPRLTGGGSGGLADFGMENWPQTVASAALEVRLRDAEDTARVPAGVRRGDPPDPGVWQAFFGAAAVNPFSPPPAYEEPTVNRTSDQASLLIDTYRNSALDLTESADRDVRSAMLVRRLAAWRGQDDEPRPPRRTTGTRRAGRQVGDPDFHRTVALLREHPAVLRALGLIVEFTLPASELDPAGSVQVGWPEAPIGPAMVSPWTAYEFDGGRFLPASSSSTTIDRGMLDLTDAPASGSAAAQNAAWVVATVDVDGGVRKLREAADAIASVPAGESALEALPTLRTAGLMLLRRNRQADFSTRRRAAVDTGDRSLNEATLAADELVLGYRVDIGTSDGRWFSLCRRRATYTIRGVPIGAARTPEEGHVKPNAVVLDRDPDVPDADEVVTRWSGWSLVVPQPTFDGHPSNRSVRSAPGFTFDFAVEERTLPTLRFGETYQMRARIVDMAGGGLELGDPVAETAATRLVSFLRYEPVLPPVVPAPEGMLARPSVLGPGDQPDRLVIRSDPADPPRYPPNDTRVLRPPSASMTLAEQHGRLDGDDESTWELVRRAMALADQVGPPAPASQPLPTLPDPAAAGVTAHIRGEVDVEDTPIGDRTGWSGDWPNLSPKRLRLEARRPGQPLLDASTGDVVVRLAPAEQVTLELSSNIRNAERGRFAIRDWLGDEFETVMTGGRHPMVTPPTVLDLVHAVRRPLQKPGGVLSPAPRAIGQTFAELRPDVSLNTASTVQLDIVAGWPEWDDRALDGDGVPRPHPVSGVSVRSFTVDRGPLSLPTLQHEFGDTRHRRVTYSLTAVSRFRQYFHPDEPAEEFLESTALDPVSIPSSARPTPPVVVSTVPAFEWPDPGELDESLFVERVGGWLRVELARPWFETGAEEQLAVIVAAGPDPPASLRPFLTQVGKDPIRATEAPPRWPTGDLLTAAVGPPRECLLPEAGQRVVVAPHAVWSDGGRLYADVALPDVARSSYTPFVQLALARYQPNSVTDLELSSIVLTDMVALPLPRALGVTREGDDVTVAVGGLGSDSDELDTNRVDVHVERCHPDAAAADLIALTPPPDGVPAWVRVPGHSASGPLSQELSLTLPPGGGRLRLSIREVEQFPPSPGQEADGTGSSELSERVVFVYTVPIP